jgi:hypothetical protein
METNKKIVQEGFDRWAAGTGNFFDLLSGDMQWTITGTSPLSKTYVGKKQFMDEVIQPLNARLYADGNWVAALWEGEATAKDGKPYNVTYCWHMQLRDGKIVRVIAFLDTMEFTDIFRRIPG